MTTAALIVLGEDWPDARVLGLSWPEYRIRSAIRNGARHIVVLTGRIAPELPAAIDRARGDGVSIQLARSAFDVADLFHPDEPVTLIAGTAIADDAVIDRLVAEGALAIACLASTADAAFELIDANARWAGLARIDGTLIRRTAAAAGEWDLASMLLRGAVSGGATRVMVEADEIDDPASSGAAVRTVRRVLGSEGGLDGRLMNWIAAQGESQLSAVAKLGPWFGALLMVGAPVAVLAGQVTAGFAILLSGMLIAAFASRAIRATMFGSRLAPVLDPLGKISVGATICAAAWVSQNSAVMVTAVVLIAVSALFDRLLRVQALRDWHATPARLACVVAAGCVFGTTGLLVVLVVATAHVFASLADAQESLSRALTSTR